MSGLQDQVWESHAGVHELTPTWLPERLSAPEMTSVFSAPTQPAMGPNPHCRDAPREKGGQQSSRVQHTEGFSGARLSRALTFPHNPVQDSLQLTNTDFHVLERGSHKKCITLIHKIKTRSEINSKHNTRGSVKNKVLTTNCD